MNRRIRCLKNTAIYHENKCECTDLSAEVDRIMMFMSKSFCRDYILDLKAEINTFEDFGNVHDIDLVNRHNLNKEKFNYIKSNYDI